MPWQRYTYPWYVSEWVPLLNFKTLSGVHLISIVKIIMIIVIMIDDDDDEEEEGGEHGRAWQG